MHQKPRYLGSDVEHVDTKLMDFDVPWGPEDSDYPISPAAPSLSLKVTV